MKKKGIYYAGLTGGRKQLAPLGALLIIVCGIPLAAAFLAHEPLAPSWLGWFFEGGILLGIILILAGIFAADIRSRS